MHRIPALLLALLAALGGVSAARPGPNTANQLNLVAPTFKVALKPLSGCPTPFELAMTRDMPNPGWTLAVDKLDRQPGRVVVHLTGKAGDGLFPQVITPVSAKVNMGRFRKGPHVVEIHYRANENAKYELVQVALLKGS